MPSPSTPLRGHSDVLDPKLFEAQCQCRTLKAQPFPRTGQVTVPRRVTQGCRWGYRPHLRQQHLPGAMLRHHELDFKILPLFHLSAGAGKRTYSLCEQPKSKINEARRVTKNSQHQRQQPAMVASCPQQAVGRAALRVLLGTD